MENEPSLCNLMQFTTALLFLNYTEDRNKIHTVID